MVVLGGGALSYEQGAPVCPAHVLREEFTFEGNLRLVYGQDLAFGWV